MSELVERFDRLNTHKKATLVSFSLIILLFAGSITNSILTPNTTPSDAVQINSVDWSVVHPNSEEATGVVEVVVEAPVSNSQDVTVSSSYGTTEEMFSDTRDVEKVLPPGEEATLTLAKGDWDNPEQPTIWYEYDSRSSQSKEVRVPPPSLGDVRLQDNQRITVRTGIDSYGDKTTNGSVIVENTGGTAVAVTLTEGRASGMQYDINLKPKKRSYLIRPHSQRVVSFDVEISRQVSNSDDYSRTTTVKVPISYGSISEDLNVPVEIVRIGPEN
ncbi:MAG: hypothetical protein ABEK16_00430 [Candidatus Nanohalobium sp.]